MKLAARIVVLAGLVALLAAPAAVAQELLEVEQERTFVYEEPDALSPVLRRLYVGELVLALERTTTAEHAEWLKLSLGAERSGYARAERFVPATGLPTVRWRPGRVIRDEKPFAIHGGMLGEFLGPSIQARYLFFTRLGVTAAGGLVMEDLAIKGRGVSFGLVSHLLLSSVTPVAGVGLVNLAYHEDSSTLNVWGVYTYGGLEWMADFGLFVGLGVTFARSLSIDVSYSWEDRAYRPATAPTFGSLGSHISSNTFYLLQPYFAAGVGF